MCTQNNSFSFPSDDHKAKIGVTSIVARRKVKAPLAAIKQRP